MPDRASADQPRWPSRASRSRASTTRTSRQDAKAWLAELGDPFQHVGADRNGRVAIDWGVYGVPETYVIDKDGRIAYRHVGPMQPQDVERTILPLLEQLK